LPGERPRFSDEPTGKESGDKVIRFHKKKPSDEIQG
jgi:hypothetical protein